MNWDALTPGQIGASAAMPGIDVNLVWADTSDFRDFLRPGQPRPALIPVIVELKRGDDGKFGDALARLSDELARQDAGEIPAAYSRLDFPTEIGYCTAQLTADYCRAVLCDPQRRYGQMIERFELQMPILPGRPRTPMPTSVPPGPAHPQRRTAGRTLIGVIDSGCPFAHEALRLAGSTRILRIWDQDDQPAFSTPHLAGVRPSDFGYGCEVSRQQLDALAGECTRNGVVAESACYERAGCADLRTRFAHGAAVLGLLAHPLSLGARTGRSHRDPPTWMPADDEASRADIVFVQLPRDCVQDSSSAGLGRFLLDGLRYILSCAGDDTERIVVNISDGSSRGTHDGNSIIEKAIVALTQDHPRRQGLHVVLAAGNAHDEERHAQLDLAACASAATVLRLQPGSESPSYVNLRLPPESQDIVIRITPPGRSEDAIGEVGDGEARAWPNAGAPVCAVIRQASRPGCVSGALIAFAPTVSTDVNAPMAPSGDWHIELRSASAFASATESTTHLHISRNQTNPGALSRGRQAVFVDVDGSYAPMRHLRTPKEDASRPPLSPIRRAGTLSSLATGPAGKNVWVAAGYILSSGNPSLYSAAGPALGGSAQRAGPDVSAATDGSPALAGVRAMGVRSGETVQVVGTSFAAPQVARELVNRGAIPTKLERPNPGRSGRGNLKPWPKK